MLSPELKEYYYYDHRLKERYDPKYIAGAGYDLRDYIPATDPDLQGYERAVKKLRESYTRNDPSGGQVKQALQSEYTFRNLSKLLNISIDRVRKFFYHHPVYEEARQSAKAKYLHVIGCKNGGEPIMFTSMREAAIKTGINRDVVKSLLLVRHGGRVMYGWQLKRQLWYETDGGFM